jgi:hypothetical protein
MAPAARPGALGLRIAADPESWELQTGYLTTLSFL